MKKGETIKLPGFTFIARRYVPRKKDNNSYLPTLDNAFAIFDGQILNDVNSIVSMPIEVDKHRKKVECRIDEYEYTATKDGVFKIIVPVLHSFGPKQACDKPALSLYSSCDKKYAEITTTASDFGIRIGSNCIFIYGGEHSLKIDSNGIQYSSNGTD